MSVLRRGHLMQYAVSYPASLDGPCHDEWKTFDIREEAEEFYDQIAKGWVEHRPGRDTAPIQFHERHILVGDWDRRAR